MKSLNYSACFDIGGTFIKYGVVSNEGDIYLSGKIPTPSDEAAIRIPEIIAEKVVSFQKNYGIQNIGISACGLIDHQRGEVLFSSNIKGYSGLPLAKLVEAKTRLPVAVENDVRSACLGEMWRGVARGRQDVVLLTLGTGIGGAVVINGRLIRGSGNLAGELGHMSIIHDGESCPCGFNGCLERYASTAAFVRHYEKLTGKQGVNGKKIMDLVRANDKDALAAYQTFTDYLATGLVNIAHLYNPEMIIIGGGFTEQGAPFLEQIQDKYNNNVMDLYKQSTEIVLAKLHNNAALYGAYVAANQVLEEM